MTPVRRPRSWVKAFGARKFRILTSSRMASSFSHGEAFISVKPERTMTLTSAPPRRRAVRQQSIAVLPPPSTKPPPLQFAHSEWMILEHPGLGQCFTARLEERAQFDRDLDVPVRSEEHT